jgi:hypothetical protein
VKKGFGLLESRPLNVASPLPCSLEFISLAYQPSEQGVSLFLIKMYPETDHIFSWLSFFFFILYMVYLEPVWQDSDSDSSRETTSQLELKPFLKTFDKNGFSGNFVIIYI